MTKYVTRVEQSQFYDEFISHFKSQQNNNRNEKFREWIQKWIFKPTKVLDFGCALGYNSHFLHAIGCDVYGIDISPKCIQYANEKYPQCNWYCGDITDGFDPGVRDFKFIIMSDVIEHVPICRHEILFQKLSEWSESNAVIIASVPNEEIYDTIKEQTYQPIEEKIKIPTLLMLLRQVGFSRIVSLFLDGGVYYRMIVQKSN